MSLRVLTDWHHPSLFESFMLTMHDRLGWAVYRVIGREWYEEGYWKHDSWQAHLIDLFLGTEESDRLGNNHYLRRDVHNPGREFHMVTLEQARSQDWDIVMSTVPGNQAGFKRFADEVGARWAVQVGNNEHGVNWGESPLALVSTNHHIPPKAHAIKYDQEIDLRPFKNVEHDTNGPISSFILEWHRGEDMWRLFRQTAFMLPKERQCLVFGNKGTILNTHPDVVREMQRAAIIWHTKNIGDGWGHVLHMALAAGRPLIGMKKFYHGMVGERAWTDKNALMLDDTSIGSVRVNMLLREPDELIRMGIESRALFDKYIDYERDTEAIRKLFEE